MSKRLKLKKNRRTGRCIRLKRGVIVPDCVLETSRKYEGEVYYFRLYIGETTDRFVVASPPNCWGYEDTYLYDCKRKCGFWSWRYHPRWITQRIRAVCDRIYQSCRKTPCFSYGDIRHIGSI